MRRHDQLTRMLQPESPAYVVETSAHRQRRRSEYRRAEVLEQSRSQNVGNRDRRRLQKDVLLSTTAKSAALTPALDPEHRIALVRFQDESQLHAQLFHPARQVVNFIRLVGNRLQFGVQMHQGVLQTEVL